MCLTCKEETSKMIFRLVVPFANRSANLILADWQIGRNISACVGVHKVTSAGITLARLAMNTAVIAYVTEIALTWYSG